MMNVKKLLALLLVAAMTVTMLPVFALAEDAVTDVAAVETVEAPAVEDVAVLPAEVPASAPVEAIETVPTEAVPVEAELQDEGEVSEEDAVAKTIDPNGNEHYYATLKEACTAALAWEGYDGWVILLKDYAFHHHNDGAAASIRSQGALATITESGCKSFNLENSSIEGITTTGFWIDLGGHTVTLVSNTPAFFVNGDAALNLTNGTIVYKYDGAETQASFIGQAGSVITCAIASTANGSTAIRDAEHMYHPKVNLKDVNIYNLTSASAPAISIATCFSTVNIYDSTVLSSCFYGIVYRRSQRTAGSAKTSDPAHFVNVYGSGEGGKKCIVGSTQAYSAVRAQDVRYPDIYATDGVFNSKTFTVYAEGDDNVVFLGSDILTKDSTYSEDATLVYDDTKPYANVPQLLSIPDVSTMETAIEAGVGDLAVPGYLAEAAYNGRTICYHPSLTYHAEAAATVAATGNYAYWQCDACGKYFEDEGALSETTLDALTIPKLSCAHMNVTHVDAIPATFTETGTADYWHCNDCLRDFADSACTEELTDLSVLTTPKRDPADTAGLSDAQLVELGAVAKVVFSDSTATVYVTLRDAYLAAAASETAQSVVLLKDQTIVETYGSDAQTTNGVINGVTGKKTAYATWNVENTTDPETTVNGFWLDLGGKTLTIRSHRSAFYVGDSVPLNIKNGTIIFGLSRNAMAVGKGVIQLNYWDNAVGTAEEYNFNPTVTLKDVNFYRVYNASTPALYAGPVIACGYLESTVNVIDATIVAQYGNAVRYRKSSSTVGLTEGAVYAHNLNLSGSTTLGSICTADDDALTAAVYATTAEVGVPTSGGTVTVNVDGSGVKFLGKGGVACAAENGPAMLPAVEKTPGTDAVSFPAIASVAAIENGTDAVPEFADVADVVSYTISLHTHSKTHVAEVPAAINVAGMAEHWYCEGCGSYWAADGETLTTAGALVLPALACPHSTIELHDAVEATTSADGNIAYWYCPVCDKYFLDSEATQETTAEAVVIPQRDPDPNLDPEEALVSFGYIVMNIAPNGNKTAFTKLSDAFTEAYTWEEAGGVIKLLTDYTFISTSTGNYSGMVTTMPGQDGYKSFDLDNTTDPAMTVKGVWFDLGGHTLTAQTKRPMFYMNDTISLNIKNGRIIASSTEDGSMAAQHSAVIRGNYGSPSATAKLRNDTRVYHPTVNLKDVEIYQLGNTVKTPFGIFFANMESTLNIVDSKVLVKGGNAIGYTRTGITADSDGTFVPEDGLKFNHVINAVGTEPGKTVIGTYGTTGYPIAMSAGYSSTLGIVSKTVTLNTNGGENITFLGTKMASVGDGVTFNYDASYAALGTYTMSVPNEETIAAGAGNAPEFFDEDSYTSIIYQTPGDAVASFNGGEAKSLVGAFRDWADAGYKGTVTLVAEPSNVDAGALYNEFGGGAFFATTSSETSNAAPRVIIGEAANGGNLTLDLGGFAMKLTATFLATDPALDDFDLTIKNGGVSVSSTSPTLLFKGERVRVRLDNATIANTASSAVNTIFDNRGNKSYTFMTNCTLSDASRGPIDVYTGTLNTGADTLLYYLKDCTISAGSQAALTRLKLSGLDGGHRPVAVVFDGACVISSLISGVISLNGDDYFLGVKPSLQGPVTDRYSLTMNPDESVLTTEAIAAATLTYGEELSLHFRYVADALRFAEIFGRSAAQPTKLTLNEDILSTVNAAIGKEGAKSEFALDLNAMTVQGQGMLLPNGGAGTEITITVTGELGDGAEKLKLFGGVPALAYASGNRYLVRKGALLESYSLNLEDNVKINLYTSEEPDSVGYLQDGAEHIIPAKDDFDAWVVDTLAAKEMRKTVDVFAAKTQAGETVVDFARGVSVKGYVDSDPAAAYEGEFAQALTETLQTLMVYGKYAEKYFSGDYTEISPEDLTEIGLAEVPAADVSNLTDKALEVTGMGNRVEDVNAESGFYGTSAVLEDAISLKFYFFGDQFNGASVTVNGEADVLQEAGVNSSYVLAPIAARNFDEQITVEVGGVGTVKDSAAGYTSRISANSNAYNIVQAMRAYGASAMRYYAVKTATIS